MLGVNLLYGFGSCSSMTSLFPFGEIKRATTPDNEPKDSSETEDDDDEDEDDENTDDDDDDDEIRIPNPQVSNSGLAYGDDDEEASNGDDVGANGNGGHDDDSDDQDDEIDDEYDEEDDDEDDEEDENQPPYKKKNLYMYEESFGYNSDSSWDENPYYNWNANEVRHPPQEENVSLEELMYKFINKVDERLKEERFTHDVEASNNLKMQVDQLISTLSKRSLHCDGEYMEEIPCENEPTRNDEHLQREFFILQEDSVSTEMIEDEALVDCASIKE
ncbi:uncharacterized protein [Nicotiana tomentosiformis]|uniref:uncharacterized protein n=1 Tax=Nicotiana tomentosiformis TaxID=4098 RepID=UPI00388C637B